MNAYEVNFDGLVGPSHNYAGLSYGNIASENNKSNYANPKQAALQGLEKMKQLHDLGFKQGLLLPHERPFIPALRRLGFTGSDENVLVKVANSDPQLLSAVSSASCMWTANAATVSPSADSANGKVNFTAANLNAKFHRAIEADCTSRILNAIFNDENKFEHHQALPSVSLFGDEGAANHTRFAENHGDLGVQLFVYGQKAFDAGSPAPKKFPARQTFEASHAIARKHQLNFDQVVFAQQSPNVIDAGVFHNDVIAVGNGNVLLYHEHAFLDSETVIEELKNKFTGDKFIPIKVESSDVSVDQAVASYLFNSQLLSRTDHSMVLVVPSECQQIPSVASYLEKLVADTQNPINDVLPFELKQSMKNGGGPACLRLRVVLTEEELNAANQRVLLSDPLYQELTLWINKHYRDRLSQDDLRDPQLLRECYNALDELTQLLGLGNVYDFQLGG